MLAEEIETKWQTVCQLDDLTPLAGISVLLSDKTQVALFYIPESESIYAVNNWDPIGRANVLSRGLLGGVVGEPLVASPLYKHRYSLKDGYCLDDPDAEIETYAVRIQQQNVQVAAK